jgi:integrase
VPPFVPGWRCGKAAGANVTRFDRAPEFLSESGRAPEEVGEGVGGHHVVRTGAALLITNGRHMEEVKDRPGHTSIRVTSDRYGHLFPRARQEFADGLDETYRRAASAGGADVRPRARSTTTGAPGGSPLHWAP